MKKDSMIGTVPLIFLCDTKVTSEPGWEQGGVHTEAQDLLPPSPYSCFLLLSSCFLLLRPAAILLLLLSKAGRRRRGKILLQKCFFCDNLEYKSKMCVWYVLKISCSLKFCNREDVRSQKRGERWYWEDPGEGKQQWILGLYVSGSSRMNV